MPNEKKPRLFLRSAEITDETAWYCGGPSIADAMSGLANYIKSYSQNCGDTQATLTTVVKSIQLTVTPMTDAEVAALPDV